MACSSSLVPMDKDNIALHLSTVLEHLKQEEVEQLGLNMDVEEILNGGEEDSKIKTDILENIKIKEESDNEIMEETMIVEEKDITLRNLSDHNVNRVQLEPVDIEANCLGKPLSHSDIENQPYKCSTAFKNTDENSSSSETEQNCLHLCEICAMPFNKISELMEHRSIEHVIDGNDVTCDKCYKVFENLDNLKEHLNGSGICKKCEQDLKFPCVLRQHICTQPVAVISSLPTTSNSIANIDSNLSGLHFCKECHGEFKSLDLLHAHEKNVLELDGIPRCLKCYKFFNNMVEAHLHLLGISRCFKCNENMYLPCMLDLHICRKPVGPVFSKTNDEMISILSIACKECGQIFKQQDKYIYHIRTVHNIVEIFCPECSKSFYSKEDLRIHQNIYHNNEILICYKCSEVFTEKRELRLHLQGPSVCLMCNVDVGSPCLIIRHKCKANFNISLREEVGHSSSNQNQGVVDNSTKYLRNICNKCGLRFKNYNAYLNHISSTHGLSVRKLRCNLCGTVFTTKSSLKEHKKIVHNKKVILRCPNCSRAFGSDVDMNVHLSGVIICEHCQKDFKYPCALKAHTCKSVI